MQFKPADIFSNLQTTDEKLIRSVEDFNSATYHVVRLLSESAILYRNKSFSTSVFLSITACEEVVKTHLGSFTNGADPSKPKKNMFRDHKTKHLMAAMPTVPMGERLKNALGEDELRKVMNLAKTGGFVKLREQALYFEQKNKELITPRDSIDKETARSLLLFAIEVFDDALVGFTSYSMEIDKTTNEIFDEVKNT